MNLINKQNQKIKEQNRIGLMTHVVLGYPNLEETRKIILLMVESGVDFIELQIPFSDPFGDGLVIREASSHALKNGFKVNQAFQLVEKLRKEDGIKIPLLFMTYFNIVHNYGIEEFCQKSKEVGVDGFIIPDYDLAAEEYDRLNFFAQKNDLYLIPFLSLDSDENEMKKVNAKANGFVYCFSRRGITGARGELVSELGSHLNRINKYVDCPLGIGFGISKAEHIEDLKGRADIVIVGSAFLQAYNNGGLSEVGQKLIELVSVLE